MSVKPSPAVDDVVKIEIDNGVAWVSFNRPDKRNCMNPTLNARMFGVLDQLEGDDKVQVIVLTGEGAAFSAGMDLKEYFRESEQQGMHRVRQVQRDAYGWWRRLRWCEKPTIAMVNGWCFGGAFAPLFACDLAICADEAQFGLSEINWGILPGGGATKVVEQLMTQRQAMYYILTGEMMGGKKAAELGLVNESVPLADLKARVQKLCDVLMEKNPVTLKACKDAFKRIIDMTYDDAEAYLVVRQESANSLDKTEGRKEGIRQFIDEKSYKPGLQAYKK